MLSDGTRTFTWQHGRQLASMTKNGVTWTYTYNADGMRTKRTNGTTTYEYVYNGSQLTQMKYNGNAVDLTYDTDGRPLTLTYQGVTYYYVTNVQGDVVGITDDVGTMLVGFEYEAYGSGYFISYNAEKAALLAQINPLGYRGYVLDVGTQLYYLQSRYYDPELGRFINADVYASTGQDILGHNMFAYCNNNPVIFLDEQGTKFRSVGAGIQGEIDFGTYTVGVEIIIYWDVEECGDNSLVVAIYTYDGCTINMEDKLGGSILATIVDNANLLMGGTEDGMNAMLDILTEGFSCSLSGVFIMGNEDFTSVSSYEGPFTSIGGSIGRLKGAVAYSSNSIALSLGAKVIGSKKPSWGFSRTHYKLQDYFTIEMR